MKPPCPDSGEIHIRLFNLALSEVELAGLELLLSPNELERANRLFTSQLRNHYIAGRGTLRTILASFLKREPADLILNTNQYGKPFLPEEPGHQGLSFNLSHSGDLAILALAEHCELGIDLEQIRNNLPFRAMAMQFFSIQEQTALFSLPAEQQLAAFYRCWTRKEAYLKGCGCGFSQPADSCEVSLLPDQPPVLLSHRTDPDQSGSWNLIDLDVPVGFCAALAVQGQIRIIRQFEKEKL